MFLEVLAELGDGGGFAGAVDAGDEDDGGDFFAVGAGGGEVEFAGLGGPVGFHFGLEEVENLIAGVDFLVAPSLVEVFHDAGGGFDAQVGEDEAVFEFVEEGLVELAAAEEGAQAADEDVAGLGQAAFELVEGGLGDFFEEAEGHGVSSFEFHVSSFEFLVTR